jgi:hypothetical protein
MLERRDLLKHEGGADSDRKLAHALQHPAATFSSWLSAASAAHHTSTTARRDVKHALASQIAWFKKSFRPALTFDLNAAEITLNCNMEDVCVERLAIPIKHYEVVRLTPPSRLTEAFEIALRKKMMPTCNHQVVSK